MKSAHRPECPPTASGSEHGSHTPLCPGKDPFGFVVAELVPAWMVPRRKYLVGERKFPKQKGALSRGIEDTGWL